MNKQDCAVLVFSKAPVPGAVKTRLAPVLSAEDTARLYQELLERTLRTVTTGARWPTQLWCTPVTDHPCFLACRDHYQVELRLQSEGDIGVRMHAALAENLPVYRAVLLVGCDCPELQHSDLELATAKLDDGYDVVLGPTLDGGYYLIGMKAAHREIFTGIAWGHSGVLQATRQRLQQLRLATYDLPLRWDLDEAVDLKRYRDLVARNN